MREIKFKAWDKYNHRWLDLFQLAFAKDGSVMAVNALDGETYGLHQVDLVEYTGLKDKNGKEIYEGDRVKYYTYDGYMGDSIVEPRDGCFYPVAHPEQRLGMRYDERQGFEIIGNIYESGELLK